MKTFFFSLLFLFSISLTAENYGSFPKDSGAFDNMHLRTGTWVEYTVDSLHKIPPASFDAERMALFFSAKVVISKFVGTYKKGHREGLWKIYNCYGAANPYRWIFKETSTYKGSYSNGPWKYYSMNGKLMIEAGFKNGVMDGTYKEYFSNGKIKTEIHFKNGHKNGKEKFFFPNGKVNFDKMYVNDYLNGAYKQYYETGKLRLQRTYKNGMLWSEQKHFDSRGNPLSTGTLQDGAGTLKLYDDFGNLSVIYTYLYGSKNGKATEYFPAGEIKREMDFIKDTINGMEKIYSVKGKVIMEAAVKKGKYDGIMKFYYMSGKPWTEYIYKKGRIASVKSVVDTNGVALDGGTLKNGTGILKKYDENGLLNDIFEYTDGYKNGSHQSFYDNGKVHYDNFYVMDTVSGYDKIYYENGNLKREGNVKGVDWKDTVKDYYYNGKLNNKLIFKNGMAWNVVTVLDTNGNAVDYGTFKNGSGTLKSFTDSGFVSGITTYENGLRNGKYTGFMKNGAVWKEQYYRNDSLHGVETVYFDNGNPRFKTTMVHGVQNGPSQVFHSNGNLWTERIYMNGALWNVTINLDANGKEMDKGSIKDGNGYVNQYDEKGVLVAKHICINGYVPDWDETRK